MRFNHFFSVGRCHTSDDKILFHSSNHNHDHQPEIIAKKKLLSEMRSKAKTTVKSTQQIVTEISEIATPGVIAALPTIRSISRTIRRQRCSTIIEKSRPKNLLDLEIPQCYQYLGPNEKFLLHDSGQSEQRFLIFITQTSLQILQKSEVWYSDGTFKVSPSLFQQLYTIHCNVDDTVMPMAYILMSHRTKQMYIDVLSKLRSHLNGFQPKSIVTDYESAMISACSQIFPDSEHYGCYFHFSQCVWRQIQKIPEAAEKYKQDPDFKLHIKALLSLAFVPKEKVEESFDKLVDSDFFSVHDFLQPLLDYMEDNWIGRMTRNARRQSRFKIRFGYINCTI